MRNPAKPALKSNMSAFDSESDYLGLADLFRTSYAIRTTEHIAGISSDATHLDSNTNMVAVSRDQ